MDNRTQHVFIVGCKGLPSAYGGYETFVDKLTEYHEDRLDIMYHVACLNAKKERFFYHRASCFNVYVPPAGRGRAIIYDMRALDYCYNYIKSHEVENAIVYVLACRIGPWMRYYQRKLHKLGARLYINPDGHEWMRRKWNKPIRMYWKLSERLMVKYSDLAICDNGFIESYIHEAYRSMNPKTTYISYGAEVNDGPDEESYESYKSWLKKHHLQEKEYYLIVGRFVPENNFETIIREFMASGTNKKLAIVATTNESLRAELSNRLHYEQDDRIQFVGTAYNQKLIAAIRYGAYAYIHGHEVGGTNPSLLESLGAGSLCLVNEVKFNVEVCRDAVMYWNTEPGVLANQINCAEKLSEEEQKQYGNLARARIVQDYSWPYIARQYEELFLK